MNKVDKIKLNKVYEYKLKDSCAVQFKVVFIGERDIAIWIAPSVYCIVFMKQDLKKKFESDDLEYLIEIPKGEIEYDFENAMFLDDIEESPNTEWVL